MCGRYAASRRPEDLVEEFEVDDAPEAPVGPSWNVAPTDPVPAVIERAPRDAAPGAEPRRALRAVRWGLVPSWAKDPGIGSRLINARVETLAEKPAFRKAYAARRCLLPADGYYEWYTTEAPPGRGKPRKQPFFIAPRDGGVLAMAGLYELWRDPTKAHDDPARWLWTATVITTRAEDDLGRIHDRMPMLVERDRWDAWLDPAGDDPAALRGLLVPAAPGLLSARAVSTAVNSVRNDGPELVQPLPPEELAPDVGSLEVGPAGEEPGRAARPDSEPTLF